jgi:hypothetical protein
MEEVRNCYVFDNPPMFDIRFGVGAGVASRYGSGSTKNIQLSFRNPECCSMKVQTLKRCSDV